MKRRMTGFTAIFLAVFFWANLFRAAAAAAQAAPSGQTPQTAMETGLASANALYQQHKYAEADAAMDGLAANAAVTALPDWPKAYYNRACAAALAGKPDKAVALLEKGAAANTLAGPNWMAKDPDLASLRKDPRFVELLARQTKAFALWGDNPALATDYKPTLSAAEKAAGLSKFWSEAKFNFVFFDRLPDLDWDRLYVETLPRALAAPTTADYYRILMEFAARLRDGHTNVYPPKALYSHFYARPPLGTRLIEDKVLVVRIDDPALKKQGLRIGDEVIAIDGTPVRAYAHTHVAPVATGFTAQDIDVRLYAYQLLAGDASRPLRLNLRHADGKALELTVARNGRDFPDKRPDAAFRLLPGNIAYLAVNTMKNDAGARVMREHFPEILQARGLIIDVRNNGGGNSRNGIALLQPIANAPIRTTWQRTRDYIAAERAWGRLPGWKVWYTGSFAPDPKLHYDGPVMVLTSARTFSAAEDFAIAFHGMHRGKLIGQTTAGSTGQPLMFKLPGGGMARLCTKDDSADDGTVFEGVGVKPDIVAAPTAADIRAGADPALEKAVAEIAAAK